MASLGQPLHPRFTLLLNEELFRIIDLLDKSKLIHKHYRWTLSPNYEEVIEWLDDMNREDLCPGLVCAECKASFGLTTCPHYIPVLHIQDHEFYLYLLGRWCAGLDKPTEQLGKFPGDAPRIIPPRDIMMTMRHLLVAQFYQYTRAGYVHFRTRSGAFVWIPPQRAG